MKAGDENLRPASKGLISLAAGLLCASSLAEEPGKLAIVAAYGPERGHAAGARAHALLEENHIFSIAAGSSGYSLCVPEAQETTARRILAQAVQSEGLGVTLLRLDHGFYEAISADAVLGATPKKARRHGEKRLAP